VCISAEQRYRDHAGHAESPDVAAGAFEQGVAVLGSDRDGVG
jgi:hypothetical protein